jgi:hypothetical protein
MLTLLSKATAPASGGDGHVYMGTKQTYGGAGNAAVLLEKQKVPAGHGLYWFTTANVEAGGLNYRTCRYKLL